MSESSPERPHRDATLLFQDGDEALGVCAR
jgi:hypothetical protein